jgi:type IV secretion system protein VirD4
MLVGKVEGKLDPYWDRASEVLISALISYLYEFREKREQTLENLLTLVSYCHRKENGLSEIDSYMDRASHRDPDSFAVRQYDKLKMAPQKTYESILSTIESKIGIFECDELRTMMASNDLNFDELGKRKIALFVVVSDTDRSMDRLANIFFSQAMMELCYYADNFCKGECLKVPVRFILDDFATNVSIEDFPRMISSIRSRGISVMLMIQAESQLETVYNAGKNTIISNCDTYLYMGGSDVETAKAVAQRCNKPLDQILYMEVGRNWIFRRGQRPINGYNLDLEELEKKYKTETKESQKEEEFEEFR